MIPQRVQLKGFLCYKEEQEISFDGNATLWMLSGLNGSGKSTTFDAVTYALFGHHRGGGQQAHELINKDCDSLLVEFDFLLDGHAYRAKRTLRRNTRGGATGTQQMFRLQAGGNGNGPGSWVAVEGTGQKREFDAWVADNIGLNYDTFTSSVLLLQGKAEKLLDSRPEGRREVLASIVDLERYERLHREADDRRKDQEAALKTLSNRLAALPPVAPEELAAVAERIAGAQEARDRARAEVERLHGLEFQARTWVELQRQVAEARQRYEQARGLLGDAAAIERAVERLRELREVYPRMQEVVGLRGPLHEAELKTKELTRLQASLTGQLSQRDHALKQAHEKRSLRKKQVEADEARQGELTARLRQAAVQLEKLKLYEQQEGDLARLRAELDRLPADAAAAVARAREEHDGLLTLSQVVPLLARFQAKREELRQALATEQAAQQRQQAVRARGEQMAAGLEKLRPQVEEAGRALQQATDEVTKAKTLLHQARAGLKEITQLHGAKVCRHCGQALTPGHVEEEKRRRSAEVAQAEGLLQQATAAQGAARAAEQGLREQLTRADRAYQEARLEYRDCQNQMKQVHADVERLVEECGQVYGEMPAPFRTRISPTPPADWLATAYPGADDVNAARSQASGLTGARRRLQHAEQVQQQWGNLKAQEVSILQNLNRLQAELPADRQAVRALHARLENEERALEKALQTQRADLKEIEKELDRLARERDQSRAQLAGIDTQLKGQELVQQHALQTIAKVRKSLPPAWQPHADTAGLRELSAWTQEKADLENARTDERGQGLQQARLNLDVLREKLAALEAEQERFPPEARLDPAAVQARLAEAREAYLARDEELSQARQERALLENRLRQRQEIEQEYLATEKELAADRLLAELLGRERLQLYLVRQAERQVVEYANAVLDRLSGGQLYLRLSGEANGEGSSAKALELEAYNRSTGEKPINVAFLSGSQKFRVAVSLALGIGQYASRQHRPIESVIIDEGFGCLDSQGRQVMIQELQNLRGQMRCILLVSHQEEFAEAFADGYHFQLESGATRVQRFQK